MVYIAQNQLLEHFISSHDGPSTRLFPALTVRRWPAHDYDDGYEYDVPGACSSCWTRIIWCIGWRKSVKTAFWSVVIGWGTGRGVFFPLVAYCSNSFSYSAGLAHFTLMWLSSLILTACCALGVRIKQARCTCFATQMSPRAVWSRRLRNMQVSRCQWSVNCCVQACLQTQRDTQGRKRVKKCSCWGYKQHSSSRKSGEWRDSNFQQSSRLANLGS